MNLQTAAIFGGVAFLLSSVAGLIGGVPLLDLLIRALFWAAVGFGLSLGLEAALRSLLPDLFVAQSPDPAPDEATSERRVDILLDEDEAPATVFEEVDEQEEPRYQARRSGVSEAEAGPPVEPEAEKASDARPAPPPGEDEDLPEIGAFLDAFKPNASEDQGEEGAAAPEYAEYAPVESQPERRSAGKVSLDGEEQDPVILAKAIQTVMKRDGQGN